MTIPLATPLPESQGTGSPDLAPSPDPPWVGALTAGTGRERDLALAELHALLTRAAPHQVRRMSAQLGDLGAEMIEVLINQSADDALVAILRKLSTFEGRSRFTTWAYKFAIYEAATAVRRTVWRDRHIDVADIQLVRDASASPADHAEAADLGRALARAMSEALTPHQRRVAVALLVEQVPIDVLAERTGTTRNALYKTLHDARIRLRARLIRDGYLPSDTSASERTPS